VRAIAILIIIIIIITFALDKKLRERNCKGVDFEIKGT
jgi:hypothetical protein